MKPIVLSITLLLSSYAAGDTVRVVGGEHWNGTVTYNGVKFTVESEGQQDQYYYPSQIKQIEFNDTYGNPPVLICPRWKQWLLFYPECGIDNMLWGWFGGNRPDGPRPKYRPAEPPKVRAASVRDARAAKGTPARLEYNNRSKPPITCFLLRINNKELTIQGRESISREEIRMLFPQRQPAEGK